MTTTLNTASAAQQKHDMPRAAKRVLALLQRLRVGTLHVHGP
jgi:hypothetical protein